MIQESKLLIGLLGRSVSGKEQTLPIEVDWEKFLRLAQIHKVEPLVYDGFQKELEIWSQVPEAIQSKLFSAYMQAIYRDSQLDYVKEQLQQRLLENQVPHIFLKGSVLKHDYPVPALRTMCDMDVLVHTEDYPKLAQIAQAMGAEMGHSDGNHRNYHFQGGVAVEFHPNLLHHETPVGTQINPGWQYAKKDCPTCTMELTEEGFYLNTICHLANHFVSGGVGVRFVLDVWVNRHLRKPEPDWEWVERELDCFGLLVFTKKIEALSELWFGNGDSDAVLEELGEYILTSGLHGTTSRAILNAVSLSPGGNQRSALLGKMFYSREEMEDRFPWVKGKPILLPVAWCVRAFRAVTRHGDKILQWGKGAGNVSDEDVAVQKEKLKRFGIERKKK